MAASSKAGMTALVDQGAAASPLYRLRPLGFAAIGYALFLFAVYWPEPRYIGFFWLLPFSQLPAPMARIASTIGPLIPQLFYFACAPLHLLRKPAVDAIVLALLRLLAFTSLIDMVLSPSFAGVLGTDAAVGVFFLISASLFMWDILLCSIGSRIADRGSVMGLLPASVPGVFIAAVAVWSILSGVSAAAQASWLAGGKPYCIAVPTSPWPYKEARSIFDLRASQTFEERRDRTTQIQNFHAILLVRVSDVEDRLWNWSIARVSWSARSELPPSLHETGVCVPKASFLSRLIGF
jgi:hypothetical protein